MTRGTPSIILGISCSPRCVVCTRCLNGCAVGCQHNRGAPMLSLRVRLIGGRSVGDCAVGNVLPVSLAVVCGGTRQHVRLLGRGLASNDRTCLDV